jgi:hypothetical protein
MINGMEYTTVANHNDTIKLSAGYDLKKNCYYMPSLEIKDFGVEISWDAVRFLFGDLLVALRNFRDRILTKENIDNLGDLRGVLEQNEGVCEDLIEILERGIEKGWDKLD